MGQVSSPQTPPGVLLFATDRLLASNANGGGNPLATHLIFFGEDAGQNNTVNDLIAMGAFAADGGIVDSLIAGTIAVGVSALSSLTTGGATGTDATANIVIGSHAAETTTRMGACVVIGTDALRTWENAGAGYPLRSVIIGCGALELVDGSGSIGDNVMIGYNCGRRGPNGASQGFTNNVFIGAETGSNATNTISGSVFIGQSAGNTFSSGGTGTSGNTAIGEECLNSTSFGSNNTAVGRTISLVSSGTTTADWSSNTLLGAAISCRGAQNVIIGFEAGLPTSGANNYGNIIIGHDAGQGLVAGTSHQFLIENNDVPGSGDPQRTLLYGLLNLGSLVVGDSRIGTNRDLPGTNILKLINGTQTGTPTGGGFFYCDGTPNALHWKTSTGLDQIFAGDGAISPAALGAGATQDYNPGASSTYNTLRLTPNAGASQLGGLAGGIGGARKTIYNLGGAVLTLNHEDAGSAGNNRFICPGAANFALANPGAVDIQYDGTSARWRVIN